MLAQCETGHAVPTRVAIHDRWPQYYSVCSYSSNPPCFGGVLIRVQYSKTSFSPAFSGYYVNAVNVQLHKSKTDSFPDSYSLETGQT